MKNFTFILVLTLSIFATNLLACSCFNFSTFCEAAQSDSKIVEIEVLEKYDGLDGKSYMDIDIVESLQGTVDDEKLTVISYGTSCDIFFDRFEIGEKLVLKFEELEPASGAANYPIFSFGFCSTSFLSLENNELSGNIEPDITTKNYDDFKNSLGQCADLSLFDRNPEVLEKHIDLFPNPTTDFLYISFAPLLNPVEVSVELFHSNGQLITALDDFSQSNYPLDLTTMAVGVYFIRIKYRDASIVKRVIKK